MKLENARVSQTFQADIFVSDSHAAATSNIECVMVLRGWNSFPPTLDRAVPTAFEIWLNYLHSAEMMLLLVGRSTADLPIAQMIPKTFCRGENKRMLAGTIYGICVALQRCPVEKVYWNATFLFCKNK